MSDFGGDIDPIIQKWTIVADEAAKKRMYEWVERTAREGAKRAYEAAQKETQKNNKREEAQFASHMRQMERRDRERLRRLAERQRAAARERLSQQEAEQRAVLLNIDHHLKSVRNLERQSHEQQLARQKAHDARMLELDRAESRESLENLRSTNRRAEALAKSNLRSQEAIVKSGLRQQEIVTQAHQDRITNRHKAMWSIVRTLTETGSRFMSSITQSALRSMGSAVGIGLSRITGVYKREGGQQEAALRSTYADQEAITRRALVRQQGIIQGFQARNSAVTQGGAGGGPIGAIMSVRNMLLGAGAFISARAIFGPVIDYQQTQIAFEGILQSSTAAEAMLAELQEFAKVTPFTFTGIADSAKQLLAVGYAADDVIPMMTTLGNTAAGLGLGEDAISGVIRALGQMKGKGKASAEELQQISEQLPGFSAIEAIAGSMGITVAEAFDEMKAGAIPADAAITAILEGMERMPGAAGAMERQSKTLAGRLSTLKDTIEILLIKAMDPFIESISKAVGMFTTFLDNLFNASGIFAVARSAILGLAIAFGSMLAYQGVLLMLDGIRLALVGITQAPWLVMFTGLVVAMTMLYRHVPGVAEAFHSLWDALSGIASGALETVRETFADLGENLLPNIAVMLRWIAKGEWVKALESLGGILREAMEGVWDALLSVADFLRPFAGLLVSAFEYAFWSVQVWLNSGGVGRLWDALGGALESAMGRFKNFDWGSLVQPALIGLAGAVAFAFGGLPLLIGTALIALSPRLRGGITEVLSGAVGAVGAALPRLLFNALHDAAEFLSGPLLATIFGPVGVRIIAGIAGAIIAGGVAIGTGLIDGLKRSLPSIIDAVQGLLSDIMQAVSDGLGGLPLIGDLLAAGFTPLEVVLQGIIPTLGLFVDLITLVPTPVLAASAAIFGLVKAWTALSVTARAQGVLSGFTGMLDTIALRTMYAGDAIGRLGTRMTNATAPAIMNGAASRVQIAMRSIGVAAQGAGAAVSAIGAAMPAIGMAAAIGIPVVLGMMQQARQKQKAWRDEINRTANSMLDLQTTAKEVLTETIRDSQAATAALMDAGVSIDQLFTSIKGSAATVGETYSVLAGMSDGLERAGISAEQFGTAVLEGDQAVRTLITTQTRGQATSTETIDLMGNLKDAYAALPDPLRDAADQMAEQAEQMLTNAAVTGQLNAAEQERLATILAMEHPEARLLDMQQDVTDRMTGAKEAADRQAEAYRNMRDRIDEVANSTSFFNDVLDRLTGNALPLTRVRENIEDAVAAFRELMDDPEASPSEQSRAFTDYAESIRTTADDLLNLNRPLREVLASYQLQRQELINQRIALGDSREEARRYAEEVLGLPPVSEMRAEFEDREATNKIARLKEKMVELASQRPTPQVRMDLERYRLQKVALDAQLEGLSNREIAVRVNLVATVDASFQRTIDNLIASSDPAQQQLGRDLQRNWMNRVPELAEGGIVTKPTLALIGEAGPEAVIPLSGNAAGSIPFTISFDASMIAAQVDAIVSIMAPMGERLVAATTPGMRMWANAVERVLGRILSGFETWGDRMVSLAVSISAAITAGITDGLREGRSEVVRITRGYARSLVGALNPLLTGIGETPIELNFAKGGIAEAHHGAQVHVFNEGRRGRGSSHGEAYIPFDPTNRTRSRELAAETARRLGGNVQWFADGGITTPTIQSGQLVPGVTGDVVGLVAEFARRLSTWSLANGGGYHVGSGYRSIEEQTRLYQRYLAGVPGQAPAAPPGRSMHNFGLASDGNHWRNLRPEEFGLRFPMSYEPWHVEPAEGRALLGDTDFPSFQPLPRPPEAGQRGWLSQVAAKLMAYVYDKTLAYAGSLTYDAAVPTLGSASASPAILAAIRQAMGIVGVPASWLGPLLTLISRESSFNPNAYNSILGATGLMQCVPLDSEILTRRGWLTHDEVRIGDETLGYNPESGRSEWTPITKIVHYENAPIVRIGNKRWGARVTPNHRWFSDTEVTRKPEHLTVCPECGYESNPRGVSTHRGRMHGVNGSATTEYVGEFVRTYDLSSHHRIRLAAQADTDGIPTLSLDEVRIIAWLQGDGTVRPALEGGFDGAIYQSKPQHVATLRALLSGVPHTESTRQRNPEYLPAVTFALRRSFVSDLWKRAEIEDIGPEAFVLSLSPEQRSAWLGAMIDAEGNRQIAGRQTKEHVRITQVDGELQDAITLAVYLEGYRPSFSAFTRYEDRHQPAGNVGMCAPHVVPSQFQEPVDLPPETVWCVKTDLETWTMRQDGQVMLTGNTIPSTFAAYALPGHGNIRSPLDNVIAGLRYILSRYGTIFNVGQAVSPTPTRGYSYGGVVDREGLYRLAEGNRREMVLPLENPSRTSALLRRLGVDTGPTDGMVRPARANVEMGSVIGVMNVNTNAADPETVATITTNKIDQRVRQIMAGV